MTPPILSKLEAVKATGSGWQARCPAHEDRLASLSVGVGHNGGTVIHCFAGCKPDAIVHALGLQLSDLLPQRSTSAREPVATYDYHDAAGVMLYQVVRFQPKDFRQRRPDGNGGWIWNMQGVARVPYHLPLLAGQETVYIAEGEKDVDNLARLGLPATTNVGGAAKWKDSDSAALKALGVKRCVLIPDNDAPGRKHMDDVAKSVKAAGLAVQLVVLDWIPNKGDVSDWIAQGHSRADLDAIVSARPYVLPGGVQPIKSGNSEHKDLADPFADRRTDAAQAERLALAVGDQYRYDHRRQAWLHYESPRWSLDGDKAIYRDALAFIRRQQSEALKEPDLSYRRSAVDYALKAENKTALDRLLSCATWLPPFADAGEKWDADPWVFACANGVIDLKTGLLRSGQPTDRITMCSPASYDPDAMCPRWWQFLSEIFCGDTDLIEFVWRLCGYMLTGVTTEQIVTLCYGKGANGKSVFLSTLASVFGDYSYSLPFSSLQFRAGGEGIPNDMAALQGRRFVSMIEANEGIRLNEARLKTLSGSDRISARFLHGEFFSFEPVAKFVMAVNHKPIVKDDSAAFWRRLRLVPFNRTFSGAERDDGLRDALAAESAGILTWCVQGCVSWQQHGLAQPSAVKEATTEYQGDSDPFVDFLSACVQDDADAETSGADFYRAYMQWAQAQGYGRHDTFTATAFGRAIADRFRKKRTLKGVMYLGIKVGSALF